MTIKIYSKHYCSEGKWDAFLLVNENAANDSGSDYREAMKMLLQTHYETSAVAIAVEMLQTILGAVEVEIGQLWGPKTVIKLGD